MKTATIVVELVGALTTTFLYFSSVPTILAFTSNETVEGFSPLPYLATMLNSAMWIFTASNALMIFKYSTGIICEAYYIAIFYDLSTQGQRRKIWWLLAVEAVFYGLALTTFFGGGDESRIKTLIGIMCLISCVYMYASPCIMMKTVIETTDLNFLPFLPILAGLLNGTFGILSAWLSQDIYTLIANSIGTGLSIAQLIVFLYVKHKCRHEQDAGFNAEDAAAEGSVVIEMAGVAGVAGEAGGSVATDLTGAGGSVATESAGAGGSVATEVAGGSMPIEMAGAASESMAIEAIEAADGSEAIEVANGSEAIEVADGSEALEAIEAADGSVATEAADGSAATEAVGGGQVSKAVVEEA